MGNPPRPRIARQQAVRSRRGDRPGSGAGPLAGAGELLGRDRFSTTWQFRDRQGRLRIGREFTALSETFATHLQAVFSLQRSLRIGGLVRPDALELRPAGPLWIHAPARGIPFSRSEFRGAGALEFASGLLRLVAELHSRSLFGFELVAERLFLDAKGVPLLAGLVQAPQHWAVGGGLDSQLLEQMGPHVDLLSLGELLGQLAARIRPAGAAEEAARQVLLTLSRELRTAESDGQPALTLAQIARRLDEAGAPVSLPAVVPYTLLPAVSGREPLLREVDTLIDRALRGQLLAGRRTHLVALSGRPGAGKSRVAAALGARVRARGHTVLAARARPDDRRLLGPLTDIIAALPPSILESGRSEAAPIPLTAPMAERRRQLEQAARLLLAGVRENPCLIVLEDIHLLPGAAVDALAYLIRDAALEEADAARLAVIATLRPGEDPEAASPAARVVEDLREEGFAERVRLPPLDPESGLAALESMGLDDPEENKRLVARSGGNARLLESLARLSRENRRESWPASVAEVFRRRLRSLSAAERRAIESVAILGGSAPVDLVAALAPPRERRGILGALMRLVGRQLLKPVAGPAFELVNRDSLEWVLERISAARSRALHRAAGRAIEASGRLTDPQVLAGHYERGGERARFLEHGRRAAAELEAAHANELALELYTRLLPLVTRRDPGLRLELLDRLAALRALVGDFPGAAEAYREILGFELPAGRSWKVYKSLGEVLRDAEDYAGAAEAFDRGLATLGSGEDLAVADLLSEKAPILARLGEIDTARGLAEMAGNLARDLPESPDLAAIHNRLGATLKFVGDYERAVSHIEAGLRISEQVGALELAAIALNNLATYVSVHGERQRAVELCLRSLEIHQKLGDINAIATTAVNVGALYLRSYDLDHAQQYLEMGLKMARRFGRSFIVAACLSNLAELNFQRARYGEAIEGRNRALRIAERLGRRQEQANQLVGLCRDYIVLGSAADGERMARRLLQLAGERDDPRLTGIADLTLAEGERVRGGPAGAREQLRRAERMLREIGASDWLTLSLILAGELDLQEGDRRGALARAGEAATIGAEAGLHPDRACALLLAAEACLYDDPTAAERLLREAEGIAGELDQPELRWRCDYLAGELQLRKGDRVGAARRFNAAREVLDQIADALSDKELAWHYMRDRRRVSLLRRARENPLA